MDKSFSVRLITPQAKLLEQDASSATLPAWDGLMGVLPNRAPIVVKLGTGELTVRGAGAGGGARSFALSEGFAQMVGNRLTILANNAVPAEQIVEADAQAELNTIASKSSTGSGPDADAQRARIKGQRQFAELKLRLARSRRSGAI